MDARLCPTLFTRLRPVLVFSMAEMIPQLLKVAYNIALLAGITTPSIVDTAVTFLVSFQALNAPLCLLAIRYTDGQGTFLS